MSFKLEIITPHHFIYQNDHLRHVRLPGAEGYIGILSGHAPMIVTLTIGEIKVNTDGGVQYFTTSGGVAEVLPYKTTLLVETAEDALAIDTKRAMQAKERALQQLKESTPAINIERVKFLLAKANNRIIISKKVQ